MPDSELSLAERAVERLAARADIAEARDSNKIELTGGGAPFERAIGRICRAGAEMIEGLVASSEIVPPVHPEEHRGYE